MYKAFGAGKVLHTSCFSGSWLCAFIGKISFTIFVKFRTSFRSLSSYLDILVCASIALTKRDSYVSLSFTIVIKLVLVVF